MPNQSDMKILKEIPLIAPSIKYKGNIKVGDLLKWKDELKNFGIDKEVIIFVAPALYCALMRCVSYTGISRVHPKNRMPLYFGINTQYLGINVWDNESICFKINAYLNENL